MAVLNYASHKSALELIAKDLDCDGIDIKSGAGAVMNACEVLDEYYLHGNSACYFKPPKIEQGGGSLWDFAATACIFKEAGAWVSDMSGFHLNLNPSHSLFMNEKGILFASDNLLARRVLSQIW